MDLPAAASSVASAAAAMFVAVDSKRGPHVTPELVVETSGRLWTFTGAGTLKVRRLRRNPTAGLLIRHGDDALVATADVQVIDAVDPLGAATSGVALDVPRVTAAFAARHSLELAGGAADYAAGRFGLVPGRRVLLAFEPTAFALLRDGRVIEADGWSAAAVTGVEHDQTGGSDQTKQTNETDDGGDADDLMIDLDAIPEEVRDLIGRDDVAVGWYSSRGPLALPARWSLDDAIALVDAELFSVTGCMTDGPVAVTIDESVALGPGGKRGVMLRGRGRATAGEADARTVTITVEADRAVTWDGMKTESVSGIRDFPDGTRHTATVSDPYKDPKKETRAG